MLGQKCLLSLIYRQGLVGVSISNVTASLTERLVRGDLSHSFGAFQTSPETYHCSPWDPTRSARFEQVQRLIIAARGTAEAIEKITLFRSGIACPHLLTKDLFLPRNQTKFCRLDIGNQPPSRIVSSTSRIGSITPTVPPEFRQLGPMRRVVGSQLQQIQSRVDSR